MPPTIDMAPGHALVYDKPINNRLQVNCTEGVLMHDLEQAGLTGPSDQWGDVVGAARPTGALIGPAGSPLPLRTAAPQRLRVEDDEAAGRSLAWDAGSGILSERLDQVLWPFVDLQDSPGETIRAFAQHYGVLTGQAQIPTSETEGSSTFDLAAGTEPLAAWEAIAKGYAALLDLATAVAVPSTASANHADQIDHYLASIHARVIIGWLRDGNRTTAMPTDEQIAGKWMIPLLNGESPVPTDPRLHLRWALPKLLGWTGVTVEPGIVGPSAQDVRYVIPTAVRLSGDSAGQHHASMSWIVPNLLPGLTVALARAVEPGDYAQCSRCGRLARIVGRRPREQRGWFGDHDYCRYLSNLDVKREAARRFRARRAGEQGSDPAPEVPSR